MSVKMLLCLHAALPCVQPPLASSDGPIGLIMAPTRELVVQIGKDIRMFTRALDFACVCAYGGSAVGDQISALKRGAEVRLPFSIFTSSMSHCALRLRCLPICCRRSWATRAPQVS